MRQDWRTRAHFGATPRRSNSAVGELVVFFELEVVERGHGVLRDGFGQGVHGVEHGAFIERHVGPVNFRVLDYQIRTVVEHGREVLVWRYAVQEATGVANKDAQGPLLALACESARLAYDAWDLRDRQVAAQA